MKTCFESGKAVQPVGKGAEATSPMWTLVAFEKCEKCSRPLTVASAWQDQPRGKAIPIEGVCNIVGLGRTAVRKKIAEGLIPRPLKWGTGRRAAARWVESEIVDLVLAKAAEASKPVNNVQGVEHA